MMRYLNTGSRGPYVMQVQSILKRIGYLDDKPDGIFGPRTAEAVKGLQRDYRLFVSGGVDFITWDIIDRYIYGFDNYKVNDGDTAESIADLYKTNTNLIKSANSLTDIDGIAAGSVIKVPYNIDVVPVDVEYTHEICQKAIKALKVRYPFIEIGPAGRSVLGNSIDYVRVGFGPRKVLINAAHHAIEWITVPLVLKFAENSLKRYINDSYLLDHRVRDIFDNTSLFIIPMVNPDGVDLVNEGLHESNEYYNELVAFQKKGINFHKQWKANIRGVDLNRNYPANWEQEKAGQIAEGITKPGPSGYGGEYPLSEPETICMTEFTNRHKFDMTISYHTQGKEIYWTYGSLLPEKSREYAEKFHKQSGYILRSNPADAQFAGYKDWFIDVHKKPGYTVEAGTGENPLPLEQFWQIYRDNELLMFSALF